MIRVLRVITRLNAGGPSKQVQLLGSIFDESSLSQLIVVGEVQNSELEIPLTNFNKIEKIKGLQRGINPIKDLQSFFRLIRIIADYRPNVIHTHLSKAWALVILAKIVMRTKTKVVHTFHGHILHSYFPTFVQPFINGIQKFLALKTDVLVAVSLETRRELLNAGIGLKSDFRVIPPGFTTLAKKDKETARLELGLRNDFFCIGFVGRFESIKRPDILAEVIVSSLSKFQNIQFFICGGGSLYEDFKNTVMHPNVLCLPWIDDLTTVYSAVDLLLLTSDNEGTPLTIIEAGKFGVPTLARGVGGVPSLIEHGVSGYLTGNLPQNFVDSIGSITEDPLTHHKVSVSAHQYFNTNYDLSTFLKSYREIYLR